MTVGRLRSMRIGALQALNTLRGCLRVTVRPRRYLHTSIVFGVTAARADRSVMTSNATVVLSRMEEVLCTLLDQACCWLTAENPATEIEGKVQRFSEVRWPHAENGALACEARIAGGWVRDKVG